ncbi:MAG: YigZ family protein [Selenomonadaceae bacterium]|nr:YigZ family protein [Selenomonadaceae bacterium]
MSLKKYKTVLSGETFETEYEINKSKFIAHVKQVEDEEEAKTFLQQLKKKYFDATHNCSAWVLGVDGGKQKSNDDGEPGGTAGNPILETIKKNDLVNVIVVVTRYFGGIKLGAGGLIRAYSHTAALGLSASKIVTMTPMQRLSITVNYNLFANVENWIRNKNITVENKDYTDNVTISLLLLPEEVETRLTELKDLTSANFSNKLEEEILVAIETKERDD